MIGPTPSPAWTSGCRWGFRALVGLRLRTVASRPYLAQYDRSLRPCAARFAAAQNTQGRGTDHLAVTGALVCRDGSSRIRTRAECGSVGRQRSISQAVPSATQASTPPRKASVQKWLPVATIENTISAG